MEGQTIQCGRCGKDVQVPAKPVDKLSAPGLHPELITDKPVLFHRREVRPMSNELLKDNVFDIDESLAEDGLTIGKILAGLVLSLAGVCVVSAMVIWWPMLRGPGGLWGSTTLGASTLTENEKKEPEQLPKDWWSKTSSWGGDFSQVPSGSNIEQISKLVAREGSANDSAAFWSLLDIRAFDNRVVGPDGSRLAVKDQVSVATILDYFKAQVLDSVSAPETSGLSDWTVLGVHQKRTTVGVLVRYFNDPWTPNAIFDDQKILGPMQRLCTFNEIAEAGKDLLNPRVVPSKSSDEEKKDKKNSHFGMLPPCFGYVVLLFDFTDGDVKWIDVVPFPSEVPMSRASGTLVQKDWVIFRRRVGIISSKDKQASSGNDEAWIDAFGEYRSAENYPFADTLIFSKTPIDQSMAEELSAATYGVSQERSKQLIKIAQVMRTNPSSFSQLSSTYSEKFPSDISADALGVSMWFQHWNSRPADERKRELGRDLLEATSRLKKVTSDPFLLDIEYRIKQSVDPNADFVSMENELQLRNFNSTSLLQAKIQQACEQGNKSELLQSIKQLNALWASQPGVSMEESTKDRWESLRSSWMPHTN
jgi:hypothetical protein